VTSARELPLDLYAPVSHIAVITSDVLDDDEDEEP
jgi:hypothetical protein